MNIFKKQLVSKKVKESFIFTATIATAFGVGGGVVGSLIAEAYIDTMYPQYVQDTVVVQQGTDHKTNQQIPELRPVTRFLGIQQDVEVRKTVAAVEPAVVSIYQGTKQGRIATGQRYFTQEQLLGNGLIITSDGWIATHRDVVTQNDATVIFQGTEYGIEQRVVDTASEVLFIKINASNLPVVVLGNSAELIAGQLSVVIGPNANVAVATIQSTVTYDARVIQSGVASDVYGYTHQLTRKVSQGAGSAVTNLAGEIVGLLTPTQQNIIPVNHFRPALVSLLRNKEILRPSLGVTYVAMSELPGAVTSSGALVLSVTAGNLLKVGDVIQRVEGQQLTREVSLTEVIQQYQAGDTLDIELLRADELITLSVQLQ